MEKFKIGDKLQVVDDRGGPGYVIGEIGIVTFVNVCKTSPEYTTYTIGNKDGGMCAKRFKLYKEKPVANGVDANGKELNFDEGDLEMFMRVVDRAGRTWIVGPESQGKLTLQTGGGYIYFYQTDKEASDQPEYIADYIYAAPKACSALDFKHKGNLIWKRQAPKTAQQIAVSELEASIKASQEKLEQLKRSM